MNPAIYCLLNANWEVHHCKCKGDPRQPEGIIKCRGRFWRWCVLKWDHFQMILRLYICDSRGNLLTRLQCIAGRWRPASPSTVSLNEWHFHFTEGRGKLVIQTSRSQKYLFRRSEIRMWLFGGSQLRHRFFFLMKLPSSLTKILEILKT